MAWCWRISAAIRKEKAPEHAQLRRIRKQETLALFFTRLRWLAERGPTPGARTGTLTLSSRAYTTLVTWNTMDYDEGKENLEEKHRDCSVSARDTKIYCWKGIWQYTFLISFFLILRITSNPTLYFHSFLVCHSSAINSSSILFSSFPQFWIIEDCCKQNRFQ